MAMCQLLSSNRFDSLTQVQNGSADISADMSADISAYIYYIYVNVCRCIGRYICKCICGYICRYICRYVLIYLQFYPVSDAYIYIHIYVYIYVYMRELLTSRIKRKYDGGAPRIVYACMPWPLGTLMGPPAGALRLWPPAGPYSRARRS